ncbi:YciI family protein [Streptacidiphilus carbonis]|uniref:YciI family protein n=1 Tax=Streptacidiphilus carbonis TaxID=105422 RepID=UPI0005A9046F|nr:YciI family protein [Streptacidiphilus carbonis]
MKYMLLMQFSQVSADFPPLNTWSQDEVAAHITFMRDADTEIAARGKLIDAQGLASPDQARIVRAGADGGPAVITDGPYPETKEFLAGYWIVDCPTPEAAYDLAAYLSTAPGPGGRPLNMPIHVQPVMDAPPINEG